MSRCAQGTSPTKFDRNARADDRAGLARFGRVVEVAVVALDQLVVLLVQRQPPDDLAACARRPRRRARRARRRCSSARRRCEPSATITAPVSVARSTIRSAPSATAWQRQSASTSRPSASVLLISIVLPLAAVTMSPGLIARPLGRFSVAPTTATQPAPAAPSAAIAATRLDHRGAAGHVELHLRHLRPGLQRDAAAVERHGLADEAERRAARAGARLVAHRDQRGLLRGALGDGGERAHAARGDALAPLDLDRQRRRSPRRARARTRPSARRREVVAGPVLQVARAVDRRGDERRVADGALELVRGWRRSSRSRPWAGVGVARRRATCSARSGSRRGSCPRRAPRRSRRSPPSGSCQQSVRGRELARPLARRGGRDAGALGGRSSSRAPSPTSSQRLPSAWASASAATWTAPRPRRAARRARRAARAALARPRTARPRPCRRRCSGGSGSVRDVHRRHDIGRAAGVRVGRRDARACGPARYRAASREAMAGPLPFSIHRPPRRQERPAPCPRP